jgi:hypothetical protein
MAMSSLLRSRVLVLVALLPALGCGSPAGDDRASGPLQAQEDLRLVVPSKSTRIAIVGAGPSGLTAADTLKQLGYQNVRVFEKNARVGGKVFSLRSGDKVAELGAVFASPDYTYVLGLADRFHVPYVAFGTKQEIIDENGVARSGSDFLQSHYPALELLAATAKYTGVLALFAAVQEPTLAITPPAPDLAMPFKDFAAKYGITPIAEALRSVLVGFGYGYYETTPAIYYLKLIGWLLKPSLPQGLAPAQYFTFPTGFGSIWESLARTLDVRLDAEVTSIARPSPTGAPLQIALRSGETFDFDEVVVSAPLNRVSGFMTLDDEERSLFADVESERYVVSMFTATGLESGEALFFHGNANPSRINHVDVWANNDPASPFVGYQIADNESSLSTLDQVLGQDVASRGGQLETVLLHQEWDYFPHVSPAALRRGFYYQVDALQGKRHTFYVGSTLAFETVEHSARQANALIRQHFPPAFLP